MYRVRQEDLPFQGSSHRFVGADNGDVNVSIFLLGALPGRGPGPHRHPYDEVQIVREGRGLWNVNGVEFEAGAGDILVVTGPLGASAAGFFCLREGIDSPLTAAHLRPPLRLAEGRALAREANAMLDLSDGLAADVRHLADRSSCRVVIDLEDVPVAQGVAEVAAAVGKDVWELACAFGEDYELLAAASDPGALSVVGRCERGSGVEIRLGGSPVPLTGWEHFFV